MDNCPHALTPSELVEIAEKPTRLDFATSELVDIGEAVAEEERQAAQRRREEQARINFGIVTDEGKLSRVEKDRSRDHIARHSRRVHNWRRRCCHHSLTKSGGYTRGIAEGAGAFKILTFPAVSTCGEFWTDVKNSPSIAALYCGTARVVVEVTCLALDRREPTRPPQPSGRPARGHRIARRGSADGAGAEPA